MVSNISDPQNPTFRSLTNTPNGVVLKDISAPDDFSFFAFERAESEQEDALEQIFILLNCGDILPTDVPTLSQWGLISMAGILGIVGFMVMRRRKATA